MSKEPRSKMVFTNPCTIDPESVDLVTKLQSLPKEVVIKFFDAKGKLYKDKKGKLRVACKVD